MISPISVSDELLTKIMLFLELSNRNYFYFPVIHPENVDAYNKTRVTGIKDATAVQNVYITDVHANNSSLRQECVFSLVDANSIDVTIPFSISNPHRLIISDQAASGSNQKL